MFDIVFINSFAEKETVLSGFNQLNGNAIPQVGKLTKYLEYSFALNWKMEINNKIYEAWENNQGWKSKKNDLNDFEMSKEIKNNHSKQQKSTSTITTATTDTTNAK